VEQSYENIEYIIIDGGSVDDTIQIIKNYGDRIHKFISEKDDGLFHAMNKGIRQATGDLLIFLNAGDYYVSPSVLEYFISKIKCEKAQLFFGRYVWEYPPTKDIVLSDNSTVIFDWDLLGLNFPHPATLYKREIFTAIGFFDESFHILADFEWNVRALIKNRIPFQYIDIITAWFRADGFSNRPSNKPMIEEDQKRIEKEYCQPGWVFNFSKRYRGKKGYMYNVAKKIISKLYDKRLNKVY
jgi:glycosyltransferase involved in cell wall biosynthesis